MVLKCSVLSKTNEFYSFAFCSFYNWETHVSTSNASPNYQVIAENSSGLLFKNKRDRKILNVDPKVNIFLRANRQFSLLLHITICFKDLVLFLLPVFHGFTSGIT